MEQEGLLSPVGGVAASKLGDDAFVWMIKATDMVVDVR